MVPKKRTNKVYHEVIGHLKDAEDLKNRITSIRIKNYNVALIHKYCK